MFTETTEEGDRGFACPYTWVLFLQGGHGWWAAWVEVSRTPDICCHTILALGWEPCLPHPRFPRFRVVERASLS